MNIEFKQNRWADEIAKLAEESILTEAVLTPKPGLVDARDSGAHKDMDIFTFIRSAISLRAGFHDMFLSGYTGNGSEKELLASLRPKGINIEGEMFNATSNINTHKGIIFSMGLLIASSGKYIKALDHHEDKLPIFNVKDTSEVLEIIKVMTEGIVEHDFRNISSKKELTHGEKLFIEHGFTGIRGEAQNGYPVIRDIAMPLLRELDAGKRTYEERLLEVLLTLMSKVEDSNIVSRGGIEALNYVKDCADEFIASGGMRQTDAYKKLDEMNADFIRRNLSPGGSADLLSLVIFLGKMERII